MFNTKKPNAQEKYDPRARPITIGNETVDVGAYGKEQEHEQVLRLYDAFYNNIQKLVLVARDKNDAIVTEGLQHYFKGVNAARLPWGEQNIITITQACFIVFSRTENALTYRLYAHNQRLPVEAFHSGEVKDIAGFADLIRQHNAAQEAPF